MPDTATDKVMKWHLKPPYMGSGGRAVERQTVNRRDGGPIPPTAVSKFSQTRSPHISPSLSGKDTKSRGSLLSGVYTKGSKRSHTVGKCVTCRGLTSSREGQLLRWQTGGPGDGSGRQGDLETTVADRGTWRQQWQTGGPGDGSFRQGDMGDVETTVADRGTWRQQSVADRGTWRQQWQTGDLETAVADRGTWRQQWQTGGPGDGSFRQGDMGDVETTVADRGTWRQQSVADRGTWGTWRQQWQTGGPGNNSGRQGDLETAVADRGTWVTWRQQWQTGGHEGHGDSSGRQGDMEIYRCL